jgi:hypothetical protein
MLSLASVQGAVPTRDECAEDARRLIYPKNALNSFSRSIKCTEPPAILESELLAHIL